MEFAFMEPILTLITSQAFLDFWRKWKLDESLKSNLVSYLNVIGAVLNYADDAQIDDRHIKAWLEDVKDALYDAEDLLDEILASNSAPETQSGSSSKVPKLLPSLISKGIEFKIKDIIDTLNPFGERIDDKMKSMVERLKTISKKKDILKLKETDGKKRSQINGRLTTPVIDESNRIYGRAQDREKIINLLDQTDEGDNNRVSVIVIYGMGGLGKTTLAQIVYNDLKKRAQIEVDSTSFNFAVQAWACVSDTFDVKKTTKDLLESATGKPSTAGDNLELLQDALKTKLRDKKFLLVLDDIWTHDYKDWEALSVPFSVGGLGSKIIVTTRDANVVNSINHQVIPHELRTLDEDDCWSLFKGIAFPNGNSNGFPELEAIGKQIVKKCKGLPLAAKTIGGVLCNQQDKKQWEDVLNSSVWGSRNEKYLPALILSYHHLPVEERQCFAYCSLFPKDYKFRKEELVLLWTAEGFVSSADGNGDLEAAGERCFSNLLSMSFFQRYGDSESSSSSWMHYLHGRESSSSSWMHYLHGRESSSSSWMHYFHGRESYVMHDRESYVMHDLIHDLAQFVSGKSYLRKDEEKNTVSNKVRRFSFEQRKYDVFMKFESISEAKCLRTFLPVGKGFSVRNYLPSKVPNQLLPQMKFLRVVSLRGYESVSQLPDSLGDLKHLRYLDLSYTKIRCLPDTINRLHNLQTLLLNNCNFLTRLPADMDGLVKLRHLSLSKFVIRKENGPGIAVLKRLSNHQKKLHISGLSNVVKATDAIDANFQQKEYLNEVILDWGENESAFWGAESSSPRNRNVEEEFMRKLRFHTNLTKLTIRGYGGKKFPEWIKDLTKLVYLEINDCRYCESLPSSLGKLSHLKDLIISGLECIKSVDDGFYGNDDPFPSLETLEFKDMKDLEEWRPPADQEKGFGRLRELSIDSCPKLANVSPRFLSLEILKINNCGSLAAFSSSHDCPLLESLEIKGCMKLSGLPRFERLRKLRLQKVPDELSRLQSLRELTLEECSEMVSFPDGGLPSMLKRLEITDCQRLETIPEGVLGNSNLLEVKISKCSSLASFDGKLDVLKSLHIYDCPRVTRLPEECISLGRLHIEGCTSLDSLPEGCISLERLHIKGCTSLSLPQLPGTLKELTVRGCESLGQIEDRGLDVLESLNIYDCPRVTRLPEGCIFLERLHIEGCTSLDSLPQLPRALKYLDVRGCDSLGPIEDRGLDVLKSLEIYDCPRVTRLPEGCISLERLHIEGCTSLDSLPQLPRTLKYLTVRGCDSLGPIEDRGLDVLHSVKIYDCPRVTRLPEGCISLERLFIERCTSLDSLPQLPRALKYLDVRGCDSLGPIEDRGLDELESLNIYDCPRVTRLPEGCISLERLHIEGCTSLDSLPQLPRTLKELTVRGCDSLGPIEDRGLDVLHSLKIYDCPRVTRLPEGCISLERLFIERCTSLDSLPQLPRALKYLDVRGCDSLGPIEDWGLAELESLDTFRFGNIPSLESLEHLLLPKSITDLGLLELPNLKTISNGLKNLTSLRQLWILNCVKLKSLPEEGLPETLGYLSIVNCPLLKRRCEEGGADWSKIADIPEFAYTDLAWVR